MILKTEGFQTQSYQSASDFLAAIKPDQPACLVLDVSMPEMTGMELQQHLLAEDSLISIIFLSGNGDIPMSVRAIKSGAVDFLTKPVKDNELLTAIHLGLKRAEEKKRKPKRNPRTQSALGLTDTPGITSFPRSCFWQAKQTYRRQNENRRTDD